MAIPAGTKFQGIPSSNHDLNKRSAQANATAPLYDISDFGGGAQTVQTITPQGTTAATTAQAIYGINVIDTASGTDFAVRLPNPVTGQQTTFVNNSGYTLYVFPSVAGGKINGVVDGVAYVPSDGKPYVFSCVQNPLPGAWVWSAPAVNQVQLPRISVPHTQALPFGNPTNAWGVGVPGFQSINPTKPDGSQCTPFFDCFGISSTSSGTVVTPSIEYFVGYNQLTPKRLVTTVKVYSNCLLSDIPASYAGQGAATVSKYSYYQDQFTGGSWANSTGGSFFLGTQSGPAPQTEAAQEVSVGVTNSPAQVGDQGTLYLIQPMNTYYFALSAQSNGYQMIGEDPVHGVVYNTFQIYIPWWMATKTYEFDIFMEHT